MISLAIRLHSQLKELPVTDAMARIFREIPRFFSYFMNYKGIVRLKDTVTHRISRAVWIFPFIMTVKKE